jgi:hypothetical protein
MPKLRIWHPLSLRMASSRPAHRAGQLRRGGNVSALANPIDRFRELGGSLWLEGERVRYRIQAGSPGAHEVLADLRRDRDAVAAMPRN